MLQVLYVSVLRLFRKKGVLMLSKSTFIRILTIASLLLVNLQWGAVSARPVASETQSVIYYVKPGANGDCLSWSTACELQTALFNATDGDQIWVASGTYKPTTSSNRETTFDLKNGVAIYGGFPADGGAWEQRDWLTNPTILSGDIGLGGYEEDNSYHVVTGISINETANMDGFIIKDGYAMMEPNNLGAGVYINNGSPILTNITITGNSAIRGGGINNYYSSPTLTNVTISENRGYGAGMYNEYSNPILNNVTFTENDASGCLGGGMYNEYSNPTLTNVSFIGNIGTYRGGGMYNDNSSPMLQNTTFSGNYSQEGGGMSNRNYSSPILINCSFTGNSADRGGGISNKSYSSPIIRNVTFNGNTADDGGGMYNETNSNPSLINATFSGNTAINRGGGVLNAVSSRPTFLNVTLTANSAGTGGGMSNLQISGPNIKNSIIWGNVPNQLSYDDHSPPTITFSDIQGGYAGLGNIDANPLLGELADNGGFTQTHALNEESPAIDAGDSEVYPAVDQRAYSRPIDGDNDGVAICDMGAYEYNSFPAIFTLTLDVVGSGSVVANPEKTDYYYGDVVTLTAIADSDWVFNGWVGDVTSMENPLTITIYDDTSITANFMFNAWVLTVSVNPEGAGTVSLNPDTPTYPFMSYVSASAIPNPGWTFAGWSGDASGTTNPTSVTMTSHKSITANFTQNEYSLNVSVNPEGMGSVAISPSKPNYHYGENVTLTATPATGWRFVDWSGDVTSIDNPLALTITGNTNVTANFTDKFYIYLPLILKN